jgi:hypothetical protein
VDTVASAEGTALAAGAARAVVEAEDMGVLMGEPARALADLTEVVGEAASAEVGLMEAAVAAARVRAEEAPAQVVGAAAAIAKIKTVSNHGFRGLRGSHNLRT